MDLGVVGLDGLVGSDTSGHVSLGSSDPEPKHKWYGSGLLKQERSAGGIIEDDDLRSSKMAKTEDDLSASKAMLRNSSVLRSNATLFSSDGYHQQQMLSFSSPKPETLLVDKASPKLHCLILTPHCLVTAETQVTVPATWHGAFTGSRGPFTPSQWMELEHQALIYKYITANVPVPSHLLIPIRKALDSAGFCNFSNGLLRPNALGWGGFHLGFSNNTDPEPGRGRHRSRKPVEGQSAMPLLEQPPILVLLVIQMVLSSMLIMLLLLLWFLATTVHPTTSLLPHQETKNMHHPLAPDNTSASNTINRKHNTHKAIKGIRPNSKGLGVGSALNESNNTTTRQTNWIPITWESSMGGPLGEGHPHWGPAKTAFGSLSNSSAGSSPRAENKKTQEGASLCNDLLGSTLGNASSLPAL
ncbi:Glutamine-Leucine-Glutamine, QLQ [Sesbania bispinosa]|nr:Glutamine-Leucine-Glutamine, QLQ [Sesbania bispinosa]